MAIIVLGINMLYINFCLLKEIHMASKGLKSHYRQNKSLNKMAVTIRIKIRHNVVYIHVASLLVSTARKRR